MEIYSISGEKVVISRGCLQKIQFDKKSLTYRDIVKELYQRLIKGECTDIEPEKARQCIINLIVTQNEDSPNKDRGEIESFAKQIAIDDTRIQDLEVLFNPELQYQFVLKNIPKVCCSNFACTIVTEDALECMSFGADHQGGKIRERPSIFDLGVTFPDGHRVEHAGSSSRRQSGEISRGGNTIRFPDSVREIHSNGFAFLAISDTAVYCWGNENYGGFLAPDVAYSIKGDVQSVHPTLTGFLIVRKSNQELVAWGAGQGAEDASAIPEYIRDALRNDIHAIYSCFTAHVAIRKSDRQLFCWGESDALRGSENTAGKRIRTVLPAHYGFLVECEEGTGWKSDEDVKGKIIGLGKCAIPNDIAKALRNDLGKFHCTSDAYLAIRESDGVVFCWGNEMRGGGIPEELENKFRNENNLRGEKIGAVHAASAGFVVVRESDGAVFGWGKALQKEVLEKLRGDVAFICASRYDFVAVTKSTGSLVSWGFGVVVGNSSGSGHSSQASKNSSIGTAIKSSKTTGTGSNEAVGTDSKIDTESKAAADAASSLPARSYYTPPSNDVIPPDIAKELEGDIAAIYPGGVFFVAIRRSDGKAFAWGSKIKIEDAKSISGDIEVHSPLKPGCYSCE